MAEEHLADVLRICSEALERNDADRAEYLNAACGKDTALRREVDQLLDQQSGATRIQGAAAWVAGSRMLPAGTRLGPYLLEAVIGSGGMGDVYRARDTRLDRMVAVKVLPPEFAANPDRLRRFEREARAVAALNHPNILIVHDVGTHDGTPYVVTELLDGETWRDVIAKRLPTYRQRVALAIQAAHGLAAAHSSGFVHRDIKPENLFLTRDGRVKILDFGLARHSGATQGAAADDSNHTQPGALIGTAAYMAPEQAQGQPVGAPGDVFAFGIVLYELLTERHPFRRETPASTVAAIFHDTPVAPSSIDPSIPPALDGVVRRCLQKEPDERYASGSGVALALETCLEAPPGSVVLREVEERSPYPGLRSFSDLDAHVFFGREAEISALWERIPARPLVAVIGSSGAGKTSFLRAGVMPARPDGWAAIACTPGTSPIRNLGQTLGPVLASDREAVGRLVAFEDPDVAVSLFSAWRRAHVGALLVVDQFEELFTLNPVETQARFAELLARIAGESGVRVVLALRDDFLMRCHDVAPLAPVFDGITPLGRLTAEGMRRALVEPAARRGYTFDDATLVDAMVSSVEGTRAPLPLLAFAVSRLWERRDRDRKLLTRAAYDDIGGVAGALAQHADATLDRIGASREGLVREIFRNLVTAEGTRAVTDSRELLSPFTDRAAAEAVLRELVGARLLTSYEVDGAEREARGDRIEIAHESLITSWPRLVRWRTQDEGSAQLRDQLKQAAHLWEEKGSTPDLLWTGTAYREFALWRERYQTPLTAAEEAFAAAMAARARRAKRLRNAAVLAVIAGLAVTSLSVWVSRQAAVAGARRAEANKLLALGQARLPEDPTEALALVTASLELDDARDARRFAVQVLSDSPPAVEVREGEAMLAIPAFSPGGARLAVGGNSAVVRVWSEDGSGPVQLWGHDISPAAPNIPRWASDQMLVTGLMNTRAERAHVWTFPEGRRVRTVEFGGVSGWNVASGVLYANVLERGTLGRPEIVAIRTWQLPDGKPETLARIDWQKLGATSCCLEPASKTWLYTKGRDLFMRPLAGAVTGADTLLARHDADVAFLQCAASGHFIVREGPGRIWRWARANGRFERTAGVPQPDGAMRGSIPAPSARWLAEPSDVPRDAVPSPMGLWFVQPPGRTHYSWRVPSLAGARSLTLRRAGSWYMANMTVHPEDNWTAVTTGSGSAVTFWPLPRGVVHTVGGYGSLLRPVAFSPDGRWLATGWNDAKPRLWPVPQAGIREARVLEPGVAMNIVAALGFDPAGRFCFSTSTMGHAIVLPLDGGPAKRLEGFAAGTFLQTAAVSPSGRRVASAFIFGTGPRELRVWDLETGKSWVFPLPGGATALARQTASASAAYAGSVSSLVFTSESVLLSAGTAGVLRWDIDKGSHEVVVKVADGTSTALALSADGRTALTQDRWLDERPRCGPLALRDLAGSTARQLPELGECVERFSIDSAGKIAVTGDAEGIIRVGRIGSGEAHLLLGHKGAVTAVALSPDGRWVASSGEDNTLRLWPMPDLSRPPLHTLPRTELIVKLKSLTNFRAVRDPAAATGWKIELGPFPGWRSVPSW